MLLIPLLDTPDTSGYLIAGYAVVFALLAFFVGSLAYRYRNLRRDEEALADLKDEPHTP